MTTNNCPHCGEPLPRVVDAFCPYCHESVRSEEPRATLELPSAPDVAVLDSHAEAQSLANQMIQNGATPGMIRSRLRKHGLSNSESDTIIKRAMASSASQARFKGLGWLIAGGLILVFGIGMIIVQLALGDSSVLVPIGIIVAGCGLLGKGLITALSGIDND